MKQDVCGLPVLMLNRGWSPIAMHSVEHCIPMLYAGSATAINFDNDQMIPMKWEDWEKLPVNAGDLAIHTRTKSIRIPTVIICSGYAKIPHKKPKKNLRGVAARDNSICQVTGKKLPPERWSIDHCLPKARGGGEEWENLALVDREINNRKGCKTNDEAGLTLIRKPFEPRSLPAANFLQSSHPHHRIFLNK